MTEMRPNDIEEEILLERAELARTLDRLQQSVSPDALVAKVEARLKQDGGALLRSIADKVAANPVAAAVTVAGLGWLMLGSSDGHSAAKVRAHTPGGLRQSPRGEAFDRNRRRASIWLLSHDRDPDASLRVARDLVSPDVAMMIDRLDDGTHAMSPPARAKVRRARLRMISSRMAAQRLRGRDAPQT